MPFRSLRAFVSFLEEKRDLHRISVEVDPVLEITEIANRVGKKKGPALLFERVKGSPFPLVINVLNAERRMEWALGRSPADVGQQLHRLADGVMPPSPRKLWSLRKDLGRVLAMRPRRAMEAPVRSNVIAPADLDRLPIAQSWPDDGGKFITFPLVITKSPVDGKQNMGVYRMQKFNAHETGMHWQIGKGGGYHYQLAEKENRSLPVAVALGADPILMMCGVLPLPEGLDEMSFAGFLRGEATRVTTLESGLQVPAEADFVLDGVVRPHERRLEGPYGDHFGHYSLAAEFPVFRVDRVWHRANALFPIAVVGKPPQEDQVIGDAIQEILLPLLKIMHPEVVDLWAYQEAGFHNLLVAGVRQRFEKEGVKTALWALGEGQLALSKCVILVDPDVNARDFRSVLRAIRRNFQPENDFILLPGTSQDTLDFTSFKMNLGSKMVIDATGGARDNAPASGGFDLGALKRAFPAIADAAALEDTLLVVKAAADGRGVLEKMLSYEPIRRFKIVAAVSPDIPLDDPVLLVWGIFTRFDCHRDTFFAETDLVRGHPRYRGPMMIDATWKTGYPAPLEMRPDVVELVDRRWRDYGFKD